MYGQVALCWIFPIYRDTFLCKGSYKLLKENHSYFGFQYIANLLRKKKSIIASYHITQLFNYSFGFQYIANLLRKQKFNYCIRSYDTNIVAPLFQLHHIQIPIVNIISKERNQQKGKYSTTPPHNENVEIWWGCTFQFLMHLKIWFCLEKVWWNSSKTL